MRNSNYFNDLKKCLQEIGLRLEKDDDCYKIKYTDKRKMYVNNDYHSESAVAKLLNVDSVKIIGHTCKKLSTQRRIKAYTIVEYEMPREYTIKFDENLSDLEKCNSLANAMIAKYANYNSEKSVNLIHTLHSMMAKYNNNYNLLIWGTVE